MSLKKINPSVKHDETYIKEVLGILARTYPDAKTALVYKSSLELLIATVLSAQCTDERVNMVTPGLFKRYRCAADYAGADLEELKKIIRSTGFFNNKAKNIKAIASKLVEEFDGEVPDSMEKLLTLPGVARKTANVVLSSAFNKAEGVVVDTHVHRLSNRLGLSDKKNPEKVEQDLMRIIPREDWIWFAHALIYHGRRICKAKKPDCKECPLNNICPSSELDDTQKMNG